MAWTQSLSMSKRLLSWRQRRQRISRLRYSSGSSSLCFSSHSAPKYTERTSVTTSAMIPSTTSSRRSDRGTRWTSLPKSNSSKMLRERMPSKTQRRNAKTWSKLSKTLRTCMATRSTRMKESSKMWMTKMTTTACRMTIAKMSRNTLMTMARK